MADVLDFLSPKKYRTFFIRLKINNEYAVTLPQIHVCRTWA